MAQSDHRLTYFLSKSWAKYRLGRRTQESPQGGLRNLLRAAAATRYGREFGFSQCLAASDTYQAFRELPVIEYADWLAWLGDLNPHLEQGPQPLVNQAWPGRIDMFCLSSGTSSGRTKYIPYSRDMVRINQTAALDLLAELVQAGFNPLAMKALYMSGCTNLERNQHGVLAGDMSAMTKFLSSRFLDRISLPPRRIAAIDSWGERLTALSELCRNRRDIKLLSGIPIWQLTFLEHLVGQGEHVFTEHLRFIIHGGMSMAPYSERLRQLVHHDAQFIEVYAASEIGIGAYQRPGEDGMRFYHGYRVFYEFEDDDGTIHPIWDLEAGQSYGLIASSCAGLWRYRLGDRLVFRSTEPLILERVGRDKTMSAFDEKVTEFECEQAMRSMTPALADFSVGPDIEGRRHVWVLVTDYEPDQTWMSQLDDRLRAQNQDYDDYRADGRIASPTFRRVDHRGSYLRLLGRDEGGQRKFPRLLSDREVALVLQHCANSSP